MLPKQPFGFFTFLLSLLVMATVAQAAAGLPDFTDLAEKSGPAVVNISTVKLVKGQNEQLKEFFQFHRPPSGTPFDDFFKQFEQFFNQPNKPMKQRSLGSGFLISKDGYIVTNNHVIAEADEIRVNLLGKDKPGQSFIATIVGKDPETDLALLKIDLKEDYPILSFGDSDALRIGEWVMAIGNPFGLDHTVTAGIISAKGRVLGSGPFDNFLQTDASINPGNSGGPLLNKNGEVIGINTAIIASGQGIGFAIPSNMAKKIIPQLKEGKQISRGWIGVSIQDVDANMAKALGMNEVKGALVNSVIAGQPAEKAGIQAGDVLINIEGHAIENANDLLRTIADLQPGKHVAVQVWRKGKARDVTVVLGQRNSENVAQGDSPTHPDQADLPLGLSLRTVTAEEASSLGLEKPEGLLVVGIQDGSPAAENDIRPGDVIMEANQRPLKSPAELAQIMETDAKAKGVLMFLIKRQGQNLFRTIPLE